MRARNLIVELEHPALGLVKSLATPIHMSGTAVSFRRHPSLLGEHTEEVLAELGYGASEIQGFRENSLVKPKRIRLVIELTLVGIRHDANTGGTQHWSTAE